MAPNASTIVVNRITKPQKMKKCMTPGMRPLQELALTEPTTTSWSLSFRPQFRGLRSSRSAEPQEADEVARRGGEGTQGRKDQQRHQDLLEHRLSLLGGRPPLGCASA